MKKAADEFERAKSRHEALQRESRTANADFRRAHEEHQATKAEYTRLADKHRDAKRDHEQAKEAFERRLAEVRAERQRRLDDKRSLAQQAGVPHQYWDDVYISTDADGNVNIYFGGVGSPEGPGHGHYVMDRFGNVTYTRNPEDDHGAHNFTDFQECQEEGRQRRRDRSSPSQRRRNAAQASANFYERMPEPEQRERPYFDSQYYDDGQAAGLTYGGSRTFETPVHGTDADGNDVTVSFGREGTSREDQTLIADGHLTSEEFYSKDEQGNPGHDHAHPHDPNRGDYTGRDKYHG